VIERIHELMKYDTAGDPISGLKWTHKTPAKIAQELRSLSIEVSPNTVARLLKQMDFKRRVNHKKVSTGSSDDRDEQFHHIAQLRKQFERQGLPILSVDTKKRELVGNFKNPGSAWRQQAIPVNDHDFRSDAEGIAIPYGVYDVQANRGTVFVGSSHDTSEFAVESIAKWWHKDGRSRYPQARRLLILADGGGSNSPQRRAWKHNLQTRLCDHHGLTVTVAHYPPGTSKYNPIEHRLFSEISKNWVGEPLVSYETILKFIETTTTSTGLEVKAYLDPETYPTKIKISDEQMSQLALSKHKTQPKRNYTLEPRNGK
jgi:hypothetical protein